MSGSQNDSWLTRPSTIRMLWLLFIGLLVLTVLAQFLIKVKGYFGLDSWFGFGAAFGFLACLILVFLARALGIFLKRRDTYYDAGTDDE